MKEPAFTIRRNRHLSRVRKGGRGWSPPHGVRRREKSGVDGGISLRGDSVGCVSASGFGSSTNSTEPFGSSIEAVDPPN